MGRTNYVLNVHPKLVNLSISWFHFEDMSSSYYIVHVVYDSDFQDQEYRETYWEILTVCVKSSNSPTKFASFSKMLRLQKTPNFIFHFSDNVCSFLINMKYSKIYMKTIQETYTVAYKLLISCNKKKYALTTGPHLIYCVFFFFF